MANKSIREGYETLPSTQKDMLDKLIEQFKETHKTSAFFMLDPDMQKIAMYALSTDNPESENIETLYNKAGDTALKTLTFLPKTENFELYELTSLDANSFRYLLDNPDKIKSFVNAKTAVHGIDNLVNLNQKIFQELLTSPLAFSNLAQLVNCTDATIGKRLHNVLLQLGDQPETFSTLLRDIGAIFSKVPSVTNSNPKESLQQARLVLLDSYHRRYERELEDDVITREDLKLEEQSSSKILQTLKTAFNKITGRPENFNEKIKKITEKNPAEALFQLLEHVAQDKMSASAKAFNESINIKQYTLNSTSITEKSESKIIIEPLIKPTIEESKSAVQSSASLSQPPLQPSDTEVSQKSEFPPQITTPEEKPTAENLEQKTANLESKINIEAQTTPTYTEEYQPAVQLDTTPSKSIESSDAAISKILRSKSFLDDNFEKNLNTMVKILTDISKILPPPASDNKEEYKEKLGNTLRQLLEKPEYKTYKTSLNNELFATVALMNKINNSQQSGALLKDLRASLSPTPAQAQVTSKSAVDEKPSNIQPSK